MKPINSVRQSNFSRDLWSEVHSSEVRSREQEAAHTGLHRWFVCNRGVQRNYWPSSKTVYEPVYDFEQVSLPDDTSETNWDILHRAEYHWGTEPVKSQFGDEVNEFWRNWINTTVSTDNQNFHETGSEEHLSETESFEASITTSESATVPQSEAPTLEPCAPTSFKKRRKCITFPGIVTLKVVS